MCKKSGYLVKHRPEVTYHYLTSQMDQLLICLLVNKTRHIWSIIR